MLLCIICWPPPPATSLLPSFKIWSPWRNLKSWDWGYWRWPVSGSWALRWQYYWLARAATIFCRSPVWPPPWHRWFCCSSKICSPGSAESRWGCSAAWCGCWWGWGRWAGRGRKNCPVSWFHYRSGQCTRRSSTLGSQLLVWRPCSRLLWSCSPAGPVAARWGGWWTEGTAGSILLLSSFYYKFIHSIVRRRHKIIINKYGKEKYNAIPAAELGRHRLLLRGQEKCEVHSP